MTYVALLRAINVGGTGRLAMRDLVALCVNTGFANVRTYIQSGNVVFDSDLDASAVQQMLCTALSAHMGKPVDVMIRTAVELGVVLRSNPFPQAAADKVYVHFLHKEPALSLQAAPTSTGEQFVAGVRELYAFYPEGLGKSKVIFPLGKVSATARNMKTVAKLVALACA